MRHLAFLVASLAVSGRAAAAPALADGCKQFQAGQYDDSIETAREGIRESPRELEWRLLILRALFIQGQTAKLPGEIAALETRYPHSLRALVLIHDRYRRCGRGSSIASDCGAVRWCDAAPSIAPEGFA